MTRKHDEVRALLPEVALGVASGDDRAAVLEHVMGCADCRRDLEKLSETADALLLLGPEMQPPAGFESRVVGRLGPTAARSPGRTRWRRALQLAAAAIIGAVAVVAPYSAVKRDDAQLGALYRQTLERANGVAFLALPLEDPRGERAGHVYGYEGEPSWVLVAVTSAQPGRY
ncbi:MAG TPA: zf-HC2 domain-containing protein, partial [Actinomycetota bacterium]|nr:zf-HC2 domain-containing protein [Actinomycetota bacterium]